MTTRSATTLTYEFHSLAKVFPLIEGAGFDDLVADIKKNGLLEPIVMFEDKVLDGRNRIRACVAAGVEPTFRPFTGDDPAALVISANLHRRHLTAEQKRDLLVKLVVAQPEKSDRTLAREAGVDHHQVSRARKKAEATGTIVPVEKRTGKDGKARKRPRKAAGADDKIRKHPAREGTSGADQNHRHHDVGAGTILAATAPAADEHDPVTAALAMVERMSEEEREYFFEDLQGTYDWDVLYEDDSDSGIVRVIVSAIGADRARALVKKMDGLITKVVGQPPLPDCPICAGSGSVEYEFGVNSAPVKVECRCVRRKRSEDFHAKLREEQAADKAREERMKQPFSFGVEATAKDGRVWASGVRLPTREEAEISIDSHARWELKKHGYSAWDGDPANPCDLTFDVKRYDEPPVMWVTKRGKRATLNFPHGTCGLMHWRPIEGGECDCKKCQRNRRRRETLERRWVEQDKECEVVERALAAGEISQEQYDEWNNSTAADPDPEWLVRLLAAKRAITSAQGNGADPEQAAEKRKAEFAALERGARDDGGDIPAFPRRSP